MEYIILDIDGILTGTIVSDLTLSQQTIFYRLLGVAGKSHSRIGFIERAPDVGFTREALYAELRVYSVEDKRVVDDTIELCLGGNDPRIIMYPTGVIEIIKWDKYQLIPKGTSKDTMAQRRLKVPKTGNPNWSREPISPTIQNAKEEKQTAVGVVKHTQIAIDSLNDLGINAVDRHTGQVLPTSKELRGNHNGDKEGG